MRLFLLLALLAFPIIATAQSAQVTFGTLRQNPDAPVEVSADNLAVDQSSGSAVFTGNVLIGQGEMRLAAGKVAVTYADNGGGIKELSATGGVTLVSGPDAAEAQRADYSIDSGTIVMTGDVLLTQGQSALTADKMTVNLRTGTAQMSGRVKTVFQPTSD